MSIRNKSCENCENKIPIGEGDFICYECAENPAIVISDYSPSDNYFKCNGKKWSEE